MQLRFSASLLAVRDLLYSRRACPLRHGRSPAGLRLPNITRCLSSASFPSASSAPLPFSSAAEDAGGGLSCAALSCVSAQLLQSQSASPRTAACVPAAGSSRVSASPRPPACSYAAALSPAAATHCAAAATPSSVATSATAAAGSSANLQGIPVVQEAEPTTAAGAEGRALCCCFSACRLLQRRFPLNILAVRRLCTTAGVREADAAASARASLIGVASTSWNLVSRKTTVPAAAAGLQVAEAAAATNAAAAAAETSARLACAAAGEMQPPAEAAAAAAAGETARRAADARGRATRTAKTRSAFKGGRGAWYFGIVTEGLKPATTVREGKAGEERLLFHSAAAKLLSCSAGNTTARTGNRTSTNSASPAAAAGAPAVSSRPSSSSSAGAAAAASAAGAASSLPNASSSSSAAAGGQQPPQQALPDVPFVKKREMNLKAGPYRRGRIFISPREDPLEFVLSCLVVFVMLYTLYKLPRGEYLWERRKRVIRERLLKEYGLTEEDLEGADSE